MLKISVNNLQNKVRINPNGVKKIILKTLSLKEIKKNGEITISFVKDSTIKGLNLRYLKKNNPTDVLAFDMAGQPGSNNIFADIVVSTDTALRNARIFKTTAFYELNLYVIHGLLHLLGYDDRTKKDKLIMRKKEESLLKSLNL